MRSNRRQFLGAMIGGLAAGAAVRTWPFRIYSFPSQIAIAHWYDDWNNFELANIPAHLLQLDPQIAKRMRGTFAPTNYRGTFLHPAALDRALARERNQI